MLDCSYVLDHGVIYMRLTYKPRRLGQSVTHFADVMAVLNTERVSQNDMWRRIRALQAAIDSFV